MGVSLESRPKIVVILKLPEGKAPLLIVRARAVLVAMTGNKWFPNPSPSLAEVEAATDALFESEAKTLTRVVDSVTERDVKRRALVARLQALASYVEAIAFANPEHAAEIVESARPMPPRCRKRRSTPLRGGAGAGAYPSTKDGGPESIALRAPMRS
jgi:hypothetical protein